MLREQIEIEFQRYPSNLNQAARGRGIRNQEMGQQKGGAVEARGRRTQVFTGTHLEKRISDLPVEPVDRFLGCGSGKWGLGEG